MAKRKEVILQETLNTPQLWEEAMGKEKLYVVDVHQKWCGPCKAITGMLKRIKNELGDDLLRFAIAEADVIPELEQYRGRCEPVFLFLASGQLVAVVRGCNAPLLQETITGTLKSEHDVLEGKFERKVIKDTMESEISEEDKEEGEEEEEEKGEIEVKKEITVALIKPDVVKNGQVEEILEKIKEADIEMVANEERTLTEEEAKSFYETKSQEVYFDDLIAYVTSGPCQVLVLTKGKTGAGIVEMWRNIIGPFDAAVAKEDSPNSLRAIYGTDATANGIHGSSSQEDAARELGFFFPDFEPPVYRATSAALSSRSRASARSRKSARTAPKPQRTLAIIRPDALKKHKDAILEKIKEAGFEISMLKEIELTREQAEAFYKDHAEKEYFSTLVDQMTSGPVLVLCLAQEDAVQKWRDMLGPKIPSEAVEQNPDSLRAQFHVEDAEVNMLHGSDSPDTAEEELKQLFNVQQTLAVIKPDALEQKDDIMGKLKEAGFMISCQKDMSLTKEIAGEIYKSKEGSEFYDDLVDHMTSGPTLMMVLSAEDAVEKLRKMMGPADPEEAKADAPDSLRAVFAKSILQNAIHSPSTAESAEEKIKVVFGDMEFNWDGTAIADASVEDDGTGQKVEEDAEPAPEAEEGKAEDETEDIKSAVEGETAEDIKSAVEGGETAEEKEQSATEEAAKDEEEAEPVVAEDKVDEDAKPEGENEPTEGEGKPDETAEAAEVAPEAGESSVDSEKRASSVASSKHSISDGDRGEDRSGDAVDDNSEIEKNSSKNDENTKEDDRSSVTSSKSEIPPDDSQTNDENSNSVVQREADKVEPVVPEDTSSRSSSDSSDSNEGSEKISKVDTGDISAENSGEIRQETSTGQEETEKI